MGKEEIKEEDKEKDYFLGDDFGISYTEVDDFEAEEEQSKLNKNLKINLNKVSKAVESFKKYREQMQREEAKKRKNFFRAGTADNMLNKFLQKKSNLVIGMSGLALVLSTISLVNSGNGASRAFIENEAELSVTSFGDDGKPAPEVLKEELGNGVMKSPESVDALKAELLNYIDGQFAKRTGSPTATVAPDGSMVFQTKEDFAYAVRDAMNFLRVEDARKNIQRIYDENPLVENTTPNGRRLYGNPKARFIIQEYSDLECPYCKGFFDTPKEVAQASNGQVAVEWIHTPLSFHDPVATQEAVAVECILDQKGNRGFWAGLQYIFDTTYGNGKGSPSMANLAESFDLDNSKYLDCINSEAVRKRIEDSKAYAAQNGINSTPSSIILDTQTGRKTVVGGAQDRTVLMEAIEKLNEEAASGVFQEETPSQAPADAQQFNNVPVPAPVPTPVPAPVENPGVNPGVPSPAY